VLTVPTVQLRPLYLHYHKRTREPVVRPECTVHLFKNG
jgi:hypothetical protein